MTGRVFNPLESVCTDQPMASTSASGTAFSNDVLGVCPKCGTTFGSAIIRKVDLPVYWCETCHVASPMKDD